MRSSTSALAAVSASLATTALAASIPAGVPSYVLDYAPIIYLYSEERYNPGDIGAQLPPNTQPRINFTAVTSGPDPLTLDNLSQLNTVPGAANGDNVYLSSVANVSTNPPFLYGVKPDPSTGETVGARSCAIIVNDHGSGLVDAFYMYFYPFNFGGVYFGLTVGNHVGDWEHNMVRFVNGTPTAVWYSQHSNGEAFTYAATEKYAGGKRVSPLLFLVSTTKSRPWN